MTNKAIIAFLLAMTLTITLATKCSEASVAPPTYGNPPTEYVSLIEVHVNDQFTSAIFVDAHGLPHMFEAHELTEELYNRGARLNQQNRAKGYYLYIAPCECGGQPK